MQKSISFYRTLTDDIFNKIGYETEQNHFFFEQNEEVKEIRINVDESKLQDNVIQLHDDNGLWDPENHNLKVCREFSINVPSFLFGDKGIAHEDSRIGIALSWYSKSSNQRGIIPIDVINNQTEPQEFKVETVFRPKQLKGTITFETVIYLIKASTDNRREFADSPGTVLGVIDIHSIIIDGSGSMFPIVEVAEEDQPLWWVVCDWTDPLSDFFNEENVRIVLNTSNKSFDALGLSKGYKSTPLLVEILSSSLQIIISKAKEGAEWDNILKGVELEEGSIGQALFYFIQTFGWDTSSPEALAKTIRNDLENRLLR